MRLARFNVQAGGLKHFVGLPIPAGGGMIAALVHFFPAPIINKLGGSLMVACIFILSFLMVSTIRYSSMKHLTLGKKSHFTILVIAMLVVLIFFLSKQTLLAAASIYVISGPLIRLYSLIRRPKSGEELSLADSAQQH